MQSRESIDLYFLKIAKQVATRSTCLDKQVGCVFVSAKNKILATGYNGAPSGFVHCTDTGICLKEKTGNISDCPAVHAEINAILQCTDTEKIHRVYTTLSPCIDCTRALLGTSATELVFCKEHKHPEPQKLWEYRHGPGKWRAIKVPEILSLLDTFKYIKRYHECLGYPRGFVDLNDILLALHAEVFEVQEEFNWKPWKDGQGTLKPGNHLCEELADILFFMGSLLEIANKTPEQLSRAFINKLNENYARIKAGGDHIART